MKKTKQLGGMLEAEKKLLFGSFSNVLKLKSTVLLNFSAFWGIKNVWVRLRLQQKMSLRIYNTRAYTDAVNMLTL